MLRARLLRFLHLLWWTFRPWEWRRGVCRAVTVRDGLILFGRFFVPVRTRRVLCDCGREWR